jgi:hypothetical protein
VNKTTEELYKYYLFVNAPIKAQSTVLGQFYDPKRDWSDALDCISAEEYEETLKIHARQREKLLKHGEV